MQPMGLIGNTPCHFIHMLPSHQAVGRSMPQRSHALASCISISILPCDQSKQHLKRVGISLFRPLTAETTI